MLTRNELARRITELSLLHGSFRLRSGAVSDRYFDKYQFESDPVLLGEIAKHMAPRIPSGTQVLAGLELGGIPLAVALSFETGLPAAFVRKGRKEYGTCRIAEGAEVRGKRVCIVEDVITTGGQARISAADLERAGARVEDLLCVIWRGGDLPAHLPDTNLRLHALFRMEGLALASTSKPKE